jgi:hypothetical protein
MKRHMRHILSPLSALLLVFVAIFAALPHDVCISKVIAQELCPCAASSDAGDNCCCCGDDSNALCGGGAGGHASHDDEAPGTSSTCFSISSDQSQVTSVERVSIPAPVYMVLAVLPLPLDLSAAQPEIARQSQEVEPGRDDVHLHRDNCVFLI